NRAECTSTPSGSPARLATVTWRSRPPRRSSTTTSASSTRVRHSSRSRGTSPLTASTSSPTASPARAAGDPGATAPTRGADIGGTVYGAPGAVPCAFPAAPGGSARRRLYAGDDARRQGAARRAPRLLRGGRDGDQGARLDGARLRAARVLLPRDRPQPGRRRALPRPGRGLRPRHRRGAGGEADHAVGPWLGARGGGGRPRARQLRRQRGVPAGHEGPPRG